MEAGADGSRRRPSHQVGVAVTDILAIVRVVVVVMVVELGVVDVVTLTVAVVVAVAIDHEI